MERARDKEPIIRAQAVVALSKLAGSEDVSDLREDELSIMEVLLDTLAYDDSACVLAVIPSPLLLTTFIVTCAVRRSSTRPLPPAPCPLS